jgi:hypothetical protein
MNPYINNILSQPIALRDALSKYPTRVLETFSFVLRELVYPLLR